MNATFPLFSALQTPGAAQDKAANTLAAARALTPHLNRSRALDRKLVASTMSASGGFHHERYATVTCVSPHACRLG